MISSVTNKMSGTTGTGAAQTISFTFPVFAESEVKVRARNTATGVETLLTLTTHYTVSLTGTGVPNYISGSITTTSTTYDTYGTDYSFHIYRATTETQDTDLIENDDLPADVIEARFDKLFCLFADLNEKVDRCLKIPITDTALITELPGSVDRASEGVEFDSDGDVTTA